MDNLTLDIIVKIEDAEKINKKNKSNNTCPF